MTVGEHFQKQIDKCTERARTALKAGDHDMKKFWLNARLGLKAKRNVLSIEELEKQFTK